MKPPFSAFALSLLCVLLLSACYFGHSYEICNTDSDCHETSECVEGLCLTRAEYQRCDPTRANLSTCPTGMACDRETAVCVATNDPDMGADTGTGDAGRDAGRDNGAEDTGDDGVDITCTEGTPCGSGARCEGYEECIAGCCVAATTCIAQDQPCDSVTYDTDGFACDLDSGRCGERCRQSNPLGCDQGRWCVAATVPTETHDGVCRLGDCNDVCFDFEDCFDGTPFACDAGSGPDSGTCIAFGRGASFCLEAGDRTLGQTCEPEAADELSCVAGLRCFNGHCVTPCSYDESNPEAGCHGDPVCVPVFDREGDNQSGVCGDACEPFADSECGENRGCTFSVGLISRAATAWICSPINTDLPELEVGDTCAAGDDPTDRCSEGAFCEPGAGDPDVGTCMQYCDPTGMVDETLAQCHPLPGAPLLGDAPGDTENGAASDFYSVAAGTFPVDVWEFVSDTEEALQSAIAAVTVAEGHAYSLVAYFDGSDYAASMILDGDSGESDFGTSLVFYNLGSELADLYLAEPGFPDTGTVGPGEPTAGGLIDLSGRDLGLGFHTEAEEGDTEWPGYVWMPPETIPLGKEIDVVVMGQHDPAPDDPDRGFQLAAFPVELPEMTELTVAARVIHASVTTPNTSVNWPGIDFDQNVLRFGEVTDEWFVSTRDVGEDEVTIRLTLLWGAGEGESLTENLVLSVPSAMTVVLLDHADTGEPMGTAFGHATPSGGSEIAWFAFNASPHDVSLVRPEVPIALDVERRAPLTHVLDISAGDHTAVTRWSSDVRGDSADPFAELVAEEAVTVPEVGSVLALGLSHTVSGTPDTRLDTLVFSPPVVSLAGVGNGLVRVINWADEAGSVIARHRREFSCIAGDVQGVGECVEME